MDPLEERVLHVLSDATNREVLAVLDEVSRELSVAELATRTVRRNTDALESGEAFERELERLHVSLHHERLPRLEQVGLVAYDPTEKTVSTIERADAEWTGIRSLGELLPGTLSGRGGAETEIGVLEGRSDVYRYARELADRAQREVFLIYACSELLDSDCLPHAQRAIERGVEFYAGAKSSDVQEFFREVLPEATVWEPQLDIMNDHGSYPAVSRLIFVDREKVAIGLWDDAGGDGERRELAMIGEGKRNPLVVLTRELLGRRLDHLDYQSDDFLNELPFDP